MDWVEIIFFYHRYLQKCSESNICTCKFHSFSNRHGKVRDSNPLSARYSAASLCVLWSSATVGDLLSFLPSLPFLDSGRVPCRSTTRGDDCLGIAGPSLPLQPISLQRAAHHAEGPSKHSRPRFSFALKHTVIFMEVSLRPTLLILDVPEQRAVPVMCDRPCGDCNKDVEEVWQMYSQCDVV